MCVARATFIIGSVDMRACSIAPGFGAAPGRQLGFLARGKPEGMERQAAPFVVHAFRRRRPELPDARRSALHRGICRRSSHGDTAISPGPRFREPALAPTRPASSSQSAL